jgi:hypothetical protein
MKSKKRRVRFGASSEAHERGYTLATSSALTTAKSVIHRVEAGDCERAFAHLLYLEEYRGAANAHNVSGTGLRRPETAGLGSETYELARRAKALFKSRCKIVLRPT